MPLYRLDDALDQIATYAVDLGDTVIEASVEDLLQFTGDGGTEYVLRGHRCEFKGFSYVVAGHPELRFVVVVFQYDIGAGLVDKLDDTAIEALADNLEDNLVEEVNADRNKLAAERLLEHVERQELLDLQYRLVRLSAGSETAVELNSQIPGEMRYVFVTEQLFPYEQRFSIEQFASCRSRVGSLSEAAQTAVERAISVERDKGEPPTLSINTDRI